MRFIAIRERVMAAALVAALALTAAGPTLAAEKTFEQEILDILRSDGKITEQQYEDLKNKAEAERAAEEKAAAAAQAKPAASTPPEENPKGYKVKYSNGLQFNRNDGMVQMKIGGRIQADFASIWPSDSLNAAVPGGEGLGVEFRRARLYFSGDLYDRIIFKAQYDFAGAGGAANFKDVYIGMKKLGPVGTVKVGNMKEPFSLEQLTSSKYITFMERALPTVLDSVRHFGLGAQNHVLDQRMTWAIGIFAPTDGRDDWFNFEPAFNLTGRITGLPFYEEEGRKLVHLGFSGTYQYRDDFEQGFGQRPEAHLAKKYVDSGDVISDGNGALAAELAWVHGPFSLQGEYKQIWIDQVLTPTTNQTNTARGTYAQASYFLTGENRAYKTKAGYFGRVTPDRSFNPKKGDWGAWELGVRYSWLDMNDKALAGGEQWDISAGLNWYLYSNVRLALNYVYADVKDSGVQRDVGLPAHVSGDVHLIETRAQIEF
jgi:phosphate-selective porin OprO/OprP